MSPLDLWDRVWGCGKGRGSAEQAELELDREEEGVWRVRGEARLFSTPLSSVFSW